jgi:hypothetical protein
MESYHSDCLCHAEQDGRGLETAVARRQALASNWADGRGLIVDVGK